MNTAEISQIVTKWVREIMGDSVKVDFGRFPSAATPVVVRQVPVDPIVKRYLSGSAICRYTFDVIILVKTLGISLKSFDGMAELDLINQAIREKRWPEDEELAVYSFTVDMLPQQMQTAEDGREAFYIRCTINYSSEGV